MGVREASATELLGKICTFESHEGELLDKNCRPESQLGVVRI